MLFKWSNWFAALFTLEVYAVPGQRQSLFRPKGKIFLRSLALEPQGLTDAKAPGRAELVTYFSPPVPDKAG